MYLVFFLACATLVAAPDPYAVADFAYFHHWPLIQQSREEATLRLTLIRDHRERFRIGGVLSVQSRGQCIFRSHIGHRTTISDPHGAWAFHRPSNTLAINFNWQGEPGMMRQISMRRMTSDDFENWWAGEHPHDHGAIVYMQLRTVYLLMPMQPQNTIFLSSASSSSSSFNPFMCTCACPGAIVDDNDDDDDNDVRQEWVMLTELDEQLATMWLD